MEFVSLHCVATDILVQHFKKILGFAFKPDYLGVTSLFLHGSVVSTDWSEVVLKLLKPKKFPCYVGRDVLVLRSAFKVQAIFKFAQILFFPELSHIFCAALCSIKITRECVDSLGSLQSFLCRCV